MTTTPSIPDSLPDGLEAYARSPDFTPETIPGKLQENHSTKPGTWGLIHVLEGRIHYRLEAPRTGGRDVAAGDTVVIEPEVLHRVAFVDPGRFFVEFYRQASLP